MKTCPVCHRQFEPSDPRQVTCSHSCGGSLRFPILSVRFWSHVDQKGKDECWNWKAACNPFGYGEFRFRHTRWLAHRVAWTLTQGEIPNGLKVLHHCDNPSCCNPNHLFLGTQLENIQDRHVKGRSRGASLKGESNPLSRLTESDILRIRELATNGQTHRWIAKQFGVKESTVSMIVHRKIWKHL